MAKIIGPKIVTNGLVLALDAANKKSYPGSGATWYDLTNRGNNGTLINSPTFNTNNGGVLSFDGVDQRVNIPDAADTSISQGTLEFIFKDERVGSNAVLVGKGNDSDNRTTFFAGSVTSTFSNESITVIGRDAGTNIQFQAYENGTSYTVTQGWLQFVYTLDGSSPAWYINGQSVSVSTALSAGSGGFLDVDPGSNLVLGGRDVFTDIPFTGDMSMFRLYSRALTSAEVLQNWNNFKSRFGL
jgi:hypothetical protein